MPKFRKKPVVIEARQFTGENHIDLLNWINTLENLQAVQNEGEIIIGTLEGEMHAVKGDWIIRGVKGEFYPCKPDIFTATYESAE